MRCPGQNVCDAADLGNSVCVVNIMPSRCCASWSLREVQVAVAQPWQNARYLHCHSPHVRFPRAPARSQIAPARAHRGCSKQVPLAWAGRREWGGMKSSDRYVQSHHSLPITHYWKPFMTRVDRRRKTVSEKTCDSQPASQNRAMPGVSARLNICYSILTYIHM